MSGTAANDKIIRIRSDMNQAIHDVQRLQGAFVNLGSAGNPALTGLINNLNTLNGATNNLGRNNGAANNNTRVLAGGLGSLSASAQAAMSSLTGMGGALGGIGFAGAAVGVTAVVGGLTALATAAVKASAANQTFLASLTTVLGDTEKASMAFDRLTDFAAKTPFSLNQAVEGFVKLKALGLQPSEAAMMSYGNTASAMGHSLSDMIEAVADGATGEFERLKSFGITTQSEGNKVKMTFGGVTTEIGKNSQEIQKYLLDLGNTKFAGAMDREAQTFNGSLSTLSDNWTQTLAKVGDAGLTSAVANVVNLIANGITAATPVLVGLGSAIGGVVDGFASMASGIGDAFSAFNTLGEGPTLLEGITFNLNLVGEGFRFVGSIAGAVFGAVGSAISNVVSYLSGPLGSALSYITGGFENSGRSWSNSIIGVLRAAKLVAQQLPSLFSIAINDVMRMFANLGTNAIALMTGKVSLGDVMAKSFANSAKAVDATFRMATARYRDEKGADATFNRMLGRETKKGGLSLDQLAGAAPKQDASADADSAAAKKAAERAKREAEFWQTLKDQVTAAGMLANQAEIYNKQLDLRKILERDLTTAEQSRVAGAIGELNTTKAITTLKQRLFEAQNEYTLELGRGKNLTDAQKSVEDDLFKYRLDALNKGVAITSEAYKLAEGELRKQLEKNTALKEQAELLKQAKDFSLNMSSGARAADDLAKLDKQYAAWREQIANGGLSSTFADQITAGYESAKLRIEQEAIKLVLDMSPTANRAAGINRADTDFKSAMAQLATMELSPEARKRIEADIYNSHKSALGRVAAEVTRDWVDQFDDLADYFGGRLSGVLRKFADGFDVIANMMGGRLTGPAGLFAKVFNRQGAYSDAAKGFSAEAIGGALKSPLKDLSKGFGDFKSMFSGDLATGITKGLTKMQAGQQLGGMVGGIGSALGLGKGFSTGSQIGGSIGGLFGPVGSIIGSLGGGLIGSLFGPSKKYATASLTGPGDAAISGNKSSMKETATGAAGAVQKGLADLASTLGGVVGNYSVAIGQWNGSWRVNDNATTKQLHHNNFTKSTLHDFGKDGEAAAVAYAIENAIKDGAITGLAPVIQKALGALGTESAIQFAKDWKAAMNDYKSMTDPITFAVEQVIEPLNTLRDTMLKVGASTEDLTKMDEYRSLKLKEALKSQLSSLTDFMAALKGEGSGVTKIDQLSTKMAEFETLRERIAKGDSSVDQSAFTSLGQSIFGLAGDVYGTATKQFQDIRTMLNGTTQDFANNVTTAFNSAAGTPVSAVTSIDNTTAAIQAQAAAQAAHYKSVEAQNALMTSYLKQIAQNTVGGTSASDYQVHDVAYNGRRASSAF